MIYRINYLFLFLVFFVSCNIFDGDTHAEKNQFDFPLPLREGNTWIFENNYFLNGTHFQTSLDTVIMGAQIEFDDKPAWQVHEYIKWVFSEPDTLFVTERIFTAEILHPYIVIPLKTDTSYFFNYEGGDALVGITYSKAFEISYGEFQNRAFKIVSEMETHEYHNYSEKILVEGIGIVESHYYWYNESDTGYTEVTLIDFDLN